MSTIAFIGLGHMGGPMAHNLLRAGHQLQVFDLSNDALTPVVNAGAKGADSAAAAVQGVDVVVSMLPASPHVANLYLGRDGEPGLLQAIAPGTLVIDSSTIAASTSQQVAQAAAQQGVDFIDAPVSGGTAGAAAGTLTFMVGGTPAQVERARPYLEAMGSNIFHGGPVGAGQTAKICNNMLLGIVMIGTSEALALGTAHGLDPQVLSEIMRRSSGGNWALEKYNPYPGVHPQAPASHGYAGGFGTDLMLKDLGLAQESAMASRTRTPLGSLARALYAAHSQAGHGHEDFSSILQWLLPPAPDTSA